MDLASIAANAGESLNSDGTLETKCPKCGGRALIEFDVILTSYCAGECGYLDANERLKTFQAAHSAQRPSSAQSSRPKTETAPERTYDRPAARSGGSAPAQNEAPDEYLRRVPPHNAAAEMGVLGAILLDNNIWSDPAYGDVSSTLKPEDFYQERNRVIYRAMIETRQRGEPIDAITLAYTLELHKSLEQCGGAQYVGELAATVPSAAHINSYAEKVRETAFKRSMASRAIEFAAHAYNGVSAEALAGEAERLFGPEALLQAQGSAMTLVRKKIEGFSWAELMKRRQTFKREYVIEDWLARGETSLWAGKVEDGKTTTLRECMFDVIRGEEFLRHRCNRTKVLCLMLDADGEQGTVAEFEKLGMAEEDSDWIRFAFEPTIASMPDPLGQVARLIVEFGAGLVVVDPFVRLREIGDFIGYQNTYFMGELSELARRTNSHLMLVCHIPRGRRDSDDVATAAFGSISFAGGVNARFVISKKPHSDVRTLRTSKGKGGGFVPLDAEYILDMNEETHRVTLGKPYDWKIQSKHAEEPVLTLLDNHPEQTWSPAAIAKELGVGFATSTCRNAGNSLFDRQKIKRFGKGTKGSPFEYAALRYQSEPEAATPARRKEWDRGGVRDQHGLGGILDATTPLTPRRREEDPG